MRGEEMAEKQRKVITIVITFVMCMSALTLVASEDADATTINIFTTGTTYNGISLQFKEIVDVADESGGGWFTVGYKWKIGSTFAIAEAKTTYDYVTYANWYHPVDPAGNQLSTWAQYVWGTAYLSGLSYSTGGPSTWYIILEHFAYPYFEWHPGMAQPNPSLWHYRGPAHATTSAPYLTGTCPAYVPPPLPIPPVGSSYPGGSCPYISTWNGFNYTLDNNILSDSEFEREELIVSDSYVIEQPLVPVNDKYIVQISEFESEYTHLDQVKLTTIDYPEDRNIAVNSTGDIFSYQEITPVTSAMDNDGNDQTETLLSDEDNGPAYDGYKGDFITLEFDDIPEGDMALLLRTDVKPGFGSGLIPIGIPTPSFVEGGGIIVSIWNENGWINIHKFWPRAYWSTDAFDISSYCEGKSNISIRLDWLGYHKINFAALANNINDSEVMIFEYSPSFAFNNKMGQVVVNELFLVDEIYATIAPGECIEMTFPYVPSEGENRAFIFESIGSYRTLNGIDCYQNINITTMVNSDEGTKINVSIEEHHIKSDKTSLSLEFVSTEATEYETATFKKFTDGIYTLNVEFEGYSDSLAYVDIELSSTLGTKTIPFIFDPAEGLSQHITMNLEENLKAITGLSYDFLTGDVIADSLDLPMFIEIAPEYLNLLIEWGLISESFDLGDGTNISGTTIAHSYVAPGEYNIIAWLSLEEGTFITSNIYQQTVVIQNSAPIPDIKVHQDVDINLIFAGRKGNSIGIRIYEDGILIQDANLIRTADQPNSVTIELDRYLSKVYDIELIYDAVHTGTNPTWLSFTSGGTTLIYSKVFNTKDGFHQGIPVPTSYLDEVIAHNLMFHFDATGSYDVDGEILLCEWSLGDGIELMGETIIHEYVVEGVYEIKLFVTDNFGATTIKTIHINIP